MAEFAWDALMREWNTAILGDAELRPFIDADALDAGWLGFPGASSEQLADLESRLGVRLPESYRTFLAYTNGWRMLNSFVEQLWPASDVDRYVARHRDLVDAWLQGRARAADAADADYFVYGPEQDPTLVRDRYWPSLVEVSDYADGVLLLNPEVISEGGEWEAWFFAPWIPGARRYRSFWNLMQGLRAMPS